MISAAILGSSLSPLINYSWINNNEQLLLNQNHDNFKYINNTGKSFSNEYMTANMIHRKDGTVFFKMKGFSEKTKLIGQLNFVYSTRV